MRLRASRFVDAARIQLRQDSARNLVRGGIAGVGATLANRVFTLVTAIIFARLLQPEAYGIYAFSIALMAVLSLATEFGMYALLVREVSEAHAMQRGGVIRGLRRNAFAFALRSSAFIAPVGLIVIWFTPLVADPRERWTLSLMLAVLPINTLVRLSATILNGLRHLALAQLVELFLLPALAFAGALAMLLATRAGLLRTPAPQLAMAIQLIVGLIALAVILPLLARAVRRAAGNSLTTPVLGLQARALPFLLIGAAGILTGQLDTVLVSVFLNNREAALYRVAAQVATLTWFGLQILQSVSAPYFASTYRTGNLPALRRLFRWSCLLSLLSALPIAAIFLIFGRALVSHVFGAAYAHAAPLLTILTIGYVINVACGPVGTLLAMIGDERFVSRLLIITSALNIVSALALVQVLGAAGIAISTGGTIALYQVVMRIRVYRRFSL